MTQKERFINTLKFEQVDQVPVMEIALWAQTRQKWIEEGAPEEAFEKGFMMGNDHFQLEGYDTINIDTASPRPPFEEKVIEENERIVKFTDGMGRTRIALKEGTVNGTRMSMDSYVDFPVKSRQDFLELRKRYEGNVEERYPDNWEDLRDALNRSDKPLTLLDPLSGTFGFYSMLRNWIGTESVSYLFYDDPGLVHECLDFLSDFFQRAVIRAVREVRFDFYIIHEDMAGKGGPLMGPELFRKFLLPHYKRLIEFLRSHGIDLIIVDTDGDFEALVPIFLEAGVDGFCPMERASGMDPVRFRKQYGKSVCMIGGIDKREIAKGPEAIDREVERAILPIIDQGGYIPTIDHAVPPDVSLDNFTYYLNAKRKALEGYGM